jgi:acetyl-CoA carboxylase biotin carboxyl carrier protein
MATRPLEKAEPLHEPPVLDASVTASFTLDQVKALVDALEGTEVRSFHWRGGGQQIVIRRGRAPAATSTAHFLAVPPVATHAPAAPSQVALAAVAPAPAAKSEAKPGVVVTSPFVGTFYRAPSPDSPPFVDVGTVVKKGQVLCIVEAMKLMNEIEAEAPGKIAEILVANATPVEFGQPLFRIEQV